MTQGETYPVKGARRTRLWITTGFILAGAFGLVAALIAGQLILGYEITGPDDLEEVEGGPLLVVIFLIATIATITCCLFSGVQLQIASQRRVIETNRSDAPDMPSEHTPRDKQA